MAASSFEKGRRLLLQPRLRQPYLWKRHPSRPLPHEASRHYCRTYGWTQRATNGSRCTVCGDDKAIRTSSSLHSTLSFLMQTHNQSACPQ